MTKESLTQEYLKEALDYDPETGVFAWKERPRHHFTCDWSWKVQGSRKGTEAGYLDPTGYIQLRIKNVLYKAHRLAFLYMEGAFPEQEVDHINHQRADNRWSNLRPVSGWDNSKNCTRRTDNKSGHTGICWASQKKLWLVQISISKKNKFIGYYHDIEDAIEARKKYETKYNYHENHGTCRS